MRAALLLALLSGCGTVKAFKQAAERLGDAAIALRDDAEARQDVTATLGSWARYASPYVIAALAIGGPLLIAWLWRKRWKAKRALKQPKT